MANTVRIKRSTTVATPTALAQGELAYSESSDNLFIGTNSSTLQKIGGNADVVKLAAIEANATADQTAAQIKTKYEGEASAFTDAQFTKLSNIETGATADQTKSDIDALGIAATSLTGSQATAITDNTAKVTNVTTNLSTTHNASTVVVNSSDGTNATIGAATATTAGIMSEAMFDQHVLNNAKTSDINHNVTTNLGYTTAATTGTVTSSDGTNAVIPAATTTLAGLQTGADKVKLDAAHTWYSSMTTADGDDIINTVNELVAVFQNHSESLNLITELDAKLTANSTIDGGTF